MALVHKHKYIANGFGWLGFQISDERIEVVDIASTEFVDQGAQQARFGLAQLVHQIATAAASRDGFPGVLENVFDLLIEFVSVGNDRNPGVGVVLQDPLTQKHHDDAFAAPLGVPNDPPFSLLDVLLGFLDADVLVHAG
jgi:hypothetical protein